MGKLYFSYLEGDNIYSCKKCRVHLTSYNELISKGFRGRTGKAYLFNNVINISSGPKEDQVLLSGLHTICDLFCKGCNTVLGWLFIIIFINHFNRKYEKAYEATQKYKEGKFILEKAHLKKEYWTY